MRKLVTIRKVSDIFPIEGADFIEVVQVDGWQCIAKKGEFKVGSKCLYFEIDSLIPVGDTRFSFLEKSKREYNNLEFYRIKTMKMRGVISQGLALPLAMFPEIDTTFDDVSEQLKVIKYDPQYSDPLGKVKTGNAQGKFPSFIPKTDQERIQNLPNYFHTMKDHAFEETLKLDGSSLTVYKIASNLTLWDRIKKFIGISVKPYHLGVCSRNLELKRSDNKTFTFINGNKSSEYVQSDFWKIVNDLDIEQYLPVGYALQGELIGPKIQSNHEKVSENQLYIFDVFSILEGRYLLPQERREFFLTHFSGTEIKHVPIVNTNINIFDECDSVASMQKRVSGQSINPNTISEGRVYKSCYHPGLSFKCISNEYLVRLSVL
jgi:RNA ligase (TIGR02306 family)